MTRSSSPPPPLEFAMSFSECLSDLLCGEASSIIVSGAVEAQSPEYSSDSESPPPPDVDEFIATLLENEVDAEARSTRFRPGHNQSVDAAVRAECVAWIIKVQQHYGFQDLTAYHSVCYFDRFLLSHHLTKKNGWPLQLLSVACLSLAAKMEEPLVPSLFDFQVEGTNFIFEPSTIQRMELLVLSVLDWRLRSVSPFCYLRFLGIKIDPTRTYTDFLTTRASDIILKTIKESSLLEYRPSCVAIATIICAANDVPKFSYVTTQHAVSWCHGLQEDEIMDCHRLIRRIMLSIDMIPNDSSSSSSSSSSPYKRRKLNYN